MHAELPHLGLLAGGRGRAVVVLDAAVVEHARHRDRAALEVGVVVQALTHLGFWGVGCECVRRGVKGRRLTLGTRNTWCEVIWYPGRWTRAHNRDASRCGWAARGSP